MSNLKELLNERILILDGGFGSAVINKNISDEDLIPKGFNAKGSNDVLNLTRPDAVEEIHAEFIAAGADIIETNTFNANRISLADYGMENMVREINLAGAKLAKKAAEEKGAFVAGSVGPTNKSLSFPVDFMDTSKRAITPDELFFAYMEQIDALYDGGCDIIIIETIFDGLNAKIALEAANCVFERKGEPLPVMISTTVNEGGRLLSGQTVEGLFAAVNQPEVISFGLNCSFGADKLEPFLRDINSFSNKHISFYPNAGLPDENGDYKDAPEIMAQRMRALAQEGLINIAGGCCGTTPQHIKAIAEALEGVKPHTVKEYEYNKASGLFPVDIEKATVFDTAASDDFNEYADEGDYDTAFDMIVDDLDDYNVIMFDATREDIEKLILTGAARPDVSCKAFKLAGGDEATLKACNRCAQGRIIMEG